MKSLLRRLLLKTLVYAGVPLALAVAGYGWLAKARLDAKLAPDGVKRWSLAAFHLVERAQTKVETSFARVLRLEVRRMDGPNWRPSDRGLVHGVYDWSPSSSAWLEVGPTLDEAKESAKLQALLVETPGQHIDALSDKDRNVREAASYLLRSRTGQDFGFRHDQPPETQNEAIEKWRKWWEENRVSWSAAKVLEGVGEILKKK